MFVAGAIGFVVAYVELLARYRDDPVRAALSWPALTYALINGGVAVLGAWWLATFFPGAVAAVHSAAAAVLKAAQKPVPVDGAKLAVVAGFGSLAVLRTSLMKLRVMTSVSQALAGRTDLPASTKAISLLLALLGLVGERVLQEAVKQVAANSGRPVVRLAAGLPRNLS